MHKEPALANAMIVRIIKHPAVSGNLALIGFLGVSIKPSALQVAEGAVRREAVPIVGRNYARACRPCKPQKGVVMTPSTNLPWIRRGISI
jgi:hypothetical protein